MKKQNYELFFIETVPIFLSPYTFPARCRSLLCTDTFQNFLAFVDHKSELTRRFPMRQIATFRPLRRYCARLRCRRRSLIESKRQVAIFLYLIEGSSVESDVLPQFKKWCEKFQKFLDFSTSRAACAIVNDFIRGSIHEVKTLF